MGQCPLGLARKTAGPREEVDLRRANDYLFCTTGTMLPFARKPPLYRVDKIFVLAGMVS
jgi:hypothetical protein